MNLELILVYSVTGNIVGLIVIFTLARAWSTEHRERIRNSHLASRFGRMVKKLYGWTDSEYENERKYITGEKHA